MASRSAGPNASSAPAGWDCSGFPAAADGKQLTAAQGKSCSRGDVKFSVYTQAGGTADSRRPRVLQGFSSPSGKIVCTNDGRLLHCLQGGRPPDYRVGESGEASKASASDVMGAPGVLPYGQQATVLGVTCSSRETGVTCRNNEGHGFFLSRESQRLF